MSGRHQAPKAAGRSRERAQSVFVRRPFVAQSKQAVGWPEASEGSDLKESYLRQRRLAFSFGSLTGSSEPSTSGNPVQPNLWPGLPLADQVRPEVQAGGASIHDAASEREADGMGEKALQLTRGEQVATSPTPGPSTRLPRIRPIQMNGGEGEIVEGQQQQIVVAQEDQPAPPDRPDWTPARAAVARLGAGMLRRATQAEYAVGELRSLMNVLSEQGVRGRAFRRAQANINSGAEDVLSLLADPVDTGQQAIRAILSTDDADMPAAMAAYVHLAVQADEDIAIVMRELLPHFIDAGRQGAKAGAGDVVEELMAAADTLHQELELRARELAEGPGAPRGRRRDVAATAVDWLDTGNNIAGVGLGVAGIIELAGVSGASGGAVAGITGGVLGILFGAIGVGLGIYGMVTGRMTQKALKKIDPSLSNDELKEVSAYAKEQKRKAILGGAAVGLVGGLAIGAGILSIIAVSAGTFGIPAIIAGVSAAALGLGLVAYKIIQKRTKRKRERRAFAETMVNEIQTAGPQAGEYRAAIGRLGLDPDDATNGNHAALIDNLEGRVGDMIKTKRQQAAITLMDKLMTGKPSEQLDAELILEALGRDPAKARKRAHAGDAKTEVARIMGKLSSW